jgi:anti-anti-sigma factor
MATSQMWKGSKFNIEREAGAAPGAVIFRLSGPFTTRDMYGTLTPVALRDLLETAPADGQSSLQIFDLTAVPYMDSAGLGMVATQYARCQRQGVQFVAVGVGPRILELLRITRLDKVIPMAATAADAKLN